MNLKRSDRLGGRPVVRGQLKAGSRTRFGSQPTSSCTRTT